MLARVAGFTGVWMLRVVVRWVASVRSRGDPSRLGW